MTTCQKAAPKAMPTKLPRSGEHRGLAKAGPFKVCKSPKKRRCERHARPKENHPTVLELQERIVKYKHHVIATQRIALSNTYFELTSKLAKEERKATQDAEDREAIHRAILAPFGDEVLEFTTSTQLSTNNGSEECQLTMVKLSDRLSLFDKKLSQSLNALTQVWTSWQQCQAEAEAAARELETAMNAEEELLKAIESSRQVLKNDINIKYDEHLSACNKGEKEFSLRQEQMKRSFALMAESIL